jgi:hypothetical protein
VSAAMDRGGCRTAVQIRVVPVPPHRSVTAGALSGFACPHSPPPLSCSHGRASTARTQDLADPRQEGATAARTPNPENTGASSGLSLLQPGVGEVDE